MQIDNYSEDTLKGGQEIQSDRVLTHTSDEFRRNPFIRDELYIYLDHNATSFIRPEVLHAMEEVSHLPLNASSIHRMGQYAKKILFQARQSLSEFIDCAPEELIFTSGGTESNNMVLYAPWDHVFILATDHDSVFKVRADVHIIPVTSQGIAQLAWLEKALQKLPKGAKILVAVQYANNETGVIQPLSEIASIVHTYGAFLHSDGIQAFGKIPFSFKDLNIDSLSIAAHKVGGPQGIGALIAKPTLPLHRLLQGGAQEKNRRAGTENMAAIVGFGALPSLIKKSTYDNLKVWHRALEEDLKDFASQYGKSCVVVSDTMPRLPNTTCISMPEVANSNQLIQFDLKGFGINTGSACSSGTIKPSRILKAMGLPESVYAHTIRISSGWNTKESDLVEFAKQWKQLFLTYHQKKEIA